MRNIFFILTLFTGLLFTGCATESKDDQIPERDENIEENLDPENSETDKSDETNHLEGNISEEITPIPTCNNMILVNSGDKIVKVSENPEIKIQHIANGLRYVCLKNGEAEIERNNAN